MKKIRDFFLARKEYFSAALRFGIISFAVFAGIGLYYCSQAYLSRTSMTGILYTIMLFLGIPGCLSLLLALLTMIAGCFGKWSMRAAGVVLCVLSTSFLLIDAIVLSQYKFHIDSAMLGLFFSDAGLELIPFSMQMFLMTAGAFVFIVLLFCGIMYLAERLHGGIWTKCACIASVVFLCGTLVFHAWHATAVFFANPELLERNQIFPGNIGLTSRHLFRRLGFKQPERFDMNEKHGAFAYPLKPIRFRENAPKYNVVFLIVDALRGDMLNPEVMPYLSKFKDSGSVFQNHFSNGNCTRVGVFSLFSGLVGTYWNQSLNAMHGSVLVDSAVDRGYQTGVFFSAALTNPEFDRTIFSKVKGMRLTRDGASKIDRDISAVRDFKEFIRNRKKSEPVFAVIMYDALHGYAFPETFKMRFENSYTTMNYLTLRKDNRRQREKVFNLIRNATAYMDTQLEDIIEFLKKELDWENTIFVITSDHGNACNEAGNNIWGHNSKFSRAQLHVPLILAGGPIRRGEFSHRTFHVDVVPSLMKMLGCVSSPEDFSSGRWIYDTEERDMMILASYSNRAMLYGDVIYEMNRSGIVYNYTLDEKDVDNPPPAKFLKKYLNEISRFSR